MFPTPQRILFLRPDTYGDLILFQPVPRLVRHLWPHAEVAVLIRKSYEDIVPLIASDGVRWLTTDCAPYSKGPGDDPEALAALRDTVRAFAPDCLVAACSDHTWIEPAVAAFLPDARQISLGMGLTDPLHRAALETVLPIPWATIYPEKVSVGTGLFEWEKNLQLADALFGREVPRWWPTAWVPENYREQAAQILAARELSSGEFVACAAAGIANVRIKSWPAAHYGATLAWLEREKGIRALLIGHVTEREYLEAVREAARAGGATPELWVGQNGEMPIVAGLLTASRFFLGNDTGALHLAAALGRPVLPIFGGGTWPRFQPVAHRSLMVVQPLPCFGCGWDCYFEDAPCVRTISVASVQRALEQFLGDDDEGQTVFEAEGLEPGARALIDAATPRLRFSRSDSADRLRQVQQLTLQAESMSRQLLVHDAEHQRQVKELQSLLQTSEQDRDARLNQVKELEALIQISEADRDARLHQIETLTALFKVSEADGGARLSQIEELTHRLNESEADRAARLRQIEDLTKWLKDSEADRTARGNLLDELAGQAKASSEQPAPLTI